MDYVDNYIRVLGFTPYDIVSKSVPRRKSVLHNLSGSERGFSERRLFSSEYSELKNEVMTVSNYFLNIYPDYCKFIKQVYTGDKFVVVYEANNHSSLYNFSFTFTNEERGAMDRPIAVDGLKLEWIVNVPASVTDIYKRDNRLLCVSNETGSNNMENSGSLHSLISNSQYKLMIFKNTRFYCTASDIDGNTVIGCKGGVMCCDRVDPRKVTYLYMERDVISIALSKNGNILCCGLSDDYMRVADLRQPLTKQNQLLCPPIGASEIMMLENDNSMIVSDEDKCLFQVFLNERRVVAKYEGSSSTGSTVFPRMMPTTSELRTPLSLNEKLDIICRTGLDNITRIWSLSSGKLLQAIKPPIPNARAHSCIVADGDRGVVALIQCQRVFIIQPSI